MSIRVRCKDDETLEIMNITMRFQRQLSTTCFTKVVSTVDKKMKLLEITLNINLIHCLINRFPDMDPYFTEINHVLLASRGYEYDGFLFS
jgi:hypothetical protein